MHRWIQILVISLYFINQSNETGFWSSYRSINLDKCYVGKERCWTSKNCLRKCGLGFKCQSFKCKKKKERKRDKSDPYYSSGSGSKKKFSDEEIPEDEDANIEEKGPAMPGFDENGVYEYGDNGFMARYVGFGKLKFRERDSRKRKKDKIKTCKEKCINSSQCFKKCGPGYKCKFFRCKLSSDRKSQENEEHDEDESYQEYENEEKGEGGPEYDHGGISGSIRSKRRSVKKDLSKEFGDWEKVPSSGAKRIVCRRRLKSGFEGRAIRRQFSWNPNARRKTKSSIMRPGLLEKRQRGNSLSSNWSIPPPRRRRIKLPLNEIQSKSKSFITQMPGFLRKSSKGNLPLRKKFYDSLANKPIRPPRRHIPPESQVRPTKFPPRTQMSSSFEFKSPIAIPPIPPPRGQRKEIPPIPPPRYMKRVKPSSSLSLLTSPSSFEENPIEKRLKFSSVCEMCKMSRLKKTCKMCDKLKKKHLNFLNDYRDSSFIQRRMESEENEKTKDDRNGFFEKIKNWVGISDDQEKKKK